MLSPVTEGSATIALLKRLAVLAAAMCLLAGVSASSFAADAGDADIDVTVQVQGDEVTVDVSLFVPASPEEVWGVLTDFDNASRFIGNLEKSEVLSRTADAVVVSQKGTVSLGLFSVTVDSITEIRLKPFEEMQSRMLSGSMKSHAATTRLIAESGGTRIVHRGLSNPDVWIPPVIGPAMIRREARLRFQQLYEEILRRKTEAARAIPPAIPGAAAPPAAP